MADKRIADFPTLESAQDTDLILVSSQNETYNITFATLKEDSKGDPGTGIDSYTEYYAVNNSTTPPADSAFSTTVVNPTASNRFLWSYTVIQYTDTTVLATNKRLLCVYGQRGDYYVTNITNYYVRSANKTGVTRTGTSGWSTTVPELTDSYPYLWSYTQFTMNDNSYQYSTACVVGSLGAKGDTGASGADGADGVGVPSGGTTGQVLKKKSSTNYDTEWVNESGGSTWGSITGTLSDQTDLKNALDAKAPVSTTYTKTDVDSKITAVTCLIVDCGTISSLPATVSNASITSDMVAVKAEFGTPDAQLSDWTVTTSTGSVTISGTLISSGSTTLKLYLVKSR